MVVHLMLKLFILVLNLTNLYEQPSFLRGRSGQDTLHPTNVFCVDVEMLSLPRQHTIVMWQNTREREIAISSTTALWSKHHALVSSPIYMIEALYTKFCREPHPGESCRSTRLVKIPFWMLKPFFFCENSCQAVQDNINRNKIKKWKLTTTHSHLMLSKRVCMCLTTNLLNNH